MKRDQLSGAQTLPRVSTQQDLAGQAGQCQSSRFSRSLSRRTVAAGPGGWFRQRRANRAGMEPGRLRDALYV